MSDSDQQEKPQLQVNEAEAERIEKLAQRIERAGGWSNGVYTDNASICALLGMAVSTLREWRRRGTFPQPYRAHKLLYDLEDVDSWLEAHRGKLTDEDSR